MHLTLPGPLDVAGTLLPLQRFGDDLLDRWDGDVLLRTAPGPAPAAPAAFSVRFSGSVDAPAATVEGPSAARGAVVRMFVHAEDALADLGRRDPVIGAVARRHHGVRPFLALDPFAALVRAITAQQINLSFATVVRRRLAEKFGTRHTVGTRHVWSLDPDRIAGVDPAEVRALQFTTRKAEYVVGLAQAIAGGSLDLAALRDAGDDDVIATLMAVRGIGRWTAEWLLARTFGRPRVVAGDLGVRKAVGLAYFGGRMPSEHDVRTATLHWGEAAGVAQQLLLHALVEGTLAGVVSESTG